MITAITFDLWDTLIHDDSDEPKRKRMGLRTKRAERRHMVWQALNEVESIDEATATLAYDVMESAFNHVWHVQHVNWTVRERVDVILAGLRRTLPAKAIDAIVRAHEEMELEVMPDPVPGAAEAVADLARDFRLAVVSDAIVSPGRCLRRWLDANGMKEYFTGFAFSDEVGHSKPHRSMFESAASQLGVALGEIVHIGDRDHNDVKGPHALGMKAILFTATRDRDRDTTTADAICSSHAELPSVVRALAAGRG
jgi:putative hydrolase of the HAD superfamily